MEENGSPNPEPSADRKSVRLSVLSAQVLLFGLAYLASAQIGNWLSLVPSHIATFWPPAGLYVGVLLRVSPRHWLPFIAAAATANILFDATLQNRPIPVAIGLTAANTLEAVIGAGLLHLFWFRGRKAGFSTLGDVLAVSIVAGAAAPLVGATVAATVMTAGFGVLDSTYWVALWGVHAVGVLLVAAIVLVVPAPGDLRSTWRSVSLGRQLEAAAMLAAVAAYSLFFFLVVAPGLHVTALALPVLLWPALRSGPLGVAAALAVMALIAARGTVSGHGPFADPIGKPVLMVALFQAFLGAVAVSAHILAAVTGEKRSAVTRLAAFNSELEAMVAARTDEIVRVNAALRDSEARARRGLNELRSIYDCAPVGLCVIDRDLRFVRVNERLAQFHGNPAADHIGRTIREVLPDLADTIEPIYRRILVTGEPTVGTEYETAVKNKPGFHRVWYASRLPLRDENGEIVGINVVIDDITERKMVEAELRRLNETLEQRVAQRTAELHAISAERARLASIAEYAPEFIGICDLLMQMIYVNPAGRRLVGIESDEEIKQNRSLECFVAEDRARVEREVFPAVLERGHWSGELTFQHYRTGERIPVFSDIFRVDDPATGRPSHYATVTRDLRERKLAEEQLRQAQKMEAVGQLTGGIAHDFNNLLTAVLGNLDLLEKRIRDEAARRLLASVKHAAERGADLTSRLLAFSRKQRLQTKRTDANELVTDMSDLLERTIGGRVRVERNLAAVPWPTVADLTQIELAILNLAINARDAMPGSGTLTIETANIPIGSAEAPKGLPTGDYVMISVGDTGTGMSEEVLAKVFEPFFTTKEVGKGSGLGLSMALGIAQQHGGGIEISSYLGRGTTARLYLPRAIQAQPQPLPQAKPSDVDALHLKAARILVVDDDPDVREFAVECLHELGHGVVAAESGRAALERVNADEALDLALVDLVMPGMSGPQFAAAARQRRPGLRILFMTGYADTSFLPDAPDAPVVRKPFRVTELAARVAEALAKDEPPVP